MDFDAVILDVDGVVTETAALHERAWKQLFDGWLADHGDARPFTHADYAASVDGKPRLDGIRDFLQSRGLHAAADEVRALGDRKNALFHEVLREVGVRVHPDAAASLRAWREAGMHLAAVSSSRNAGPVLERAGLGATFETRVDGLDLEAHGFEGKPAPDLYVEAARRLGVPPARCVGFEDATAGVEACRRSHLGLVVGVARRGGAADLHRHGADRVVERLDAIAGDLAPGRPPEALPPADDPQALRAVLGERRPALFLDFDGTLTPIVADPESARLSEETRRVLRTLTAHCTVAVVSGRDLEDVKRRVGVPGLWYAGSHGYDIAGPGGERMVHPAGEAALPALEAAGRSLETALGGVPGALVERKRFAVAVHFRMAPPDRHAAIRRAAEEVGAAHPQLRVTEGKMIRELRPAANWDKGRAVLWLMEAIGVDEDREAPVYLGDDLTDEDAFRVLFARGAGVVVGRPPHRTLARLRLGDPLEVRGFLQDVARGPEDET